MSSRNRNDNKYLGVEGLKLDIGRRAARGGVVTIVSQGVRFIITIVATSVMARLLTPKDYGLIGMVVIFTNFVLIFRDLGLSTATIQKPEITHDQVSTLFWVNVALSTVIMGITCAMAPAIAWFYSEPRLVTITMVTSLGFLLGGLAVQHEALLRRQMKFTSLATISTLSLLAAYTVGICAAWYGLSYWALVFSQLALVSTNTIAVWIVCRWRPSLPKRGSEAGAMITFGGNLTGFATINYFSRNLDNLLIGRFWGAQQLGLYNRSYQLMTLPIDQINEPITSVAVPALSRLTDSEARYKEAYLRMLEKIAILTMPLIALMIGASDWIILLVLGPNWIEARLIFLLLGISGLLQPIANTTGWLFVTQGRSRQMLHWGFISGPIVMTSIVVGLPWGAVGVAGSYAFVRVFINDPLLYWFVGRSGPVRAMDFYRTVAPFLCAAVVTLLAFWGFRHWTQVQNPLIGIMYGSVITLITTFVVLAVIPRGRRALKDIKYSLAMLVRQSERATVNNLIAPK